MNRAVLSVEFLGLPGSGKSALSCRLGRFLSERGFAVDETSFHLSHGPRRMVRVVRKSIHVCAEILRHPVYAAGVIATVGATGQPGHWIFLKMSFNWLLVSSLLRAPRHGATIALHDQGLFQALWSIGLGSGAGAIETTCARLGGAMPVASLVVLVEADRRAIRARLESRPENDSRLDRRGGDQDDLQRRAEDLMQVVRSRLDTMRGDPCGPGLVVVQNADGGLEACARDLGERIERLVHEEKEDRP